MNNVNNDIDCTKLDFDEMMNTINEEFPVGAAYLKVNGSQSFSTPLNERCDGIYSSTTLKVYPKSGELPNNETQYEIYMQCQRLGELCGVQESRVQFVVNDEEGVQRIVRDMKLNEPEKYVVESTASCGQKAVWLFDSEEHFLTVKDFLEETNYLEKSLPEFIQSEPIVTLFAAT